VRDKEIHSVREHFFTRNDAPYLAVLVTYSEPAVPIPAERRTPDRPPRDESWRQLLTKETEPLFESLRSWRSARAKSEGIPPYVIFTNRQLAEIVASRPASLAALSEVDGVGRAKCEQYGLAVLGLLGPAHAEEAQVVATAETPPAAEGDRGGE
jgi:superfamily II DNA helicase RecQ